MAMPKCLPITPFSMEAGSFWFDEVENKLYGPYLSPRVAGQVRDEVSRRQAANIEEPEADPLMDYADSDEYREKLTKEGANS